MANLYLDICLSDIPKELIKTAGNGKKYLKAIIRPRKDTDPDGYDHYIAAYVRRDHRNQDDRPYFIGRAQDKSQEERHTGGSPFPERRKRQDDLPPDYDHELGF